MLQKMLMIGALMFCGVINAQATEDKGNEKDLTPSILVCNEEENKQFNSTEQEKLSSLFFSVLGEEDKEVTQLLACKHCH